ncbi:MAG: 1-deoxy-D-xylulose-5-phosphate synthase [Desulfovibrionaceae bacterium]|nr:1-deoxy-D-xylulose-5-phosphate synthase [Desulfovibrionaceae bacterium]
MTNDPTPNRILPKIQHPADVALLTPEEKTRLAEELRETIVRTVAANGGHLAPSLGVVELTLALLSVFNPARDRMVWDVGHQAYAWKLLTGRANNFSTLRQHGGISGFPRRSESPYDHFGVGHSSTSISAALGMAMARDLSDDPDVRSSHVLAIIGDGALTAGLAFEGLNQAGAMGRRLIVILNDNEMSISKNVGALSLFLSRNLESGWARRLRHEVRDFLKSIPGIGNEMAGYASRTHSSLKTVFTPGMLFEAFRFNYVGPVDGHDIGELERHLRMAASIEEPVLLHVLTQKGHGYRYAEENPSRFHGLGKFDPETGKSLPKPAGTPPSWTDVFGETLCALAEKDRRIVAVTAAMASGTGTDKMRERFPSRFVDVGICEQHAVTFAAGLATQGLRPFVALYSTFAQRAYDQIVHDVCLQNLPVTLCLDRAGLVGEDGATHHGVFDIAYLRHIPNLAIIAPRDEGELQRALCMAPDAGSPLAIRYPRGAGEGAKLADLAQALPAPHPAGQGDVLHGDPQQGDALIIAAGSMAWPAVRAAEALEKEGLRVCVYDPWWICPLPEKQILALAQNFPCLLAVEEGSAIGGFGEGVEDLLARHDMLNGRRIRRLAIPDAFIEHGTQKELRRSLGLDEEGIADAVRSMCAANAV